MYIHIFDDVILGCFEIISEAWQDIHKYSQLQSSTQKNNVITGNLLCINWTSLLEAMLNSKQSKIFTVI